MSLPKAKYMQRIIEDSSDGRDGGRGGKGAYYQGGKGSGGGGRDTNVAKLGEGGDFAETP